MKLKKYAKFLGVVTLAMGLATGCSSTGSKDSMSKDDQAVKQLISEAKTKLSEASKSGYAWRDTGKFIKQAEEALKKGDSAKASSLAKKAIMQSDLAKKQSMDQDKAIKARFN